MLYMYDFKTITPDKDITTTALVKFKDYYGNIAYYVFNISWSETIKEYVFEEAGGEQYWTINQADVLAWISLDELNTQVYIESDKDKIAFRKLYDTLFCGGKL